LLGRLSAAWATPPLLWYKFQWVSKSSSPTYTCISSGKIKYLFAITFWHQTVHNVNLFILYISFWTISYAFSTFSVCLSWDSVTFFLTGSAFYIWTCAFIFTLLMVAFVDFFVLRPWFLAEVFSWLWAKPINRSIIAMPPSRVECGTGSVTQCLVLPCILLIRKKA
jgi:hypothetical protein